MPGLNIAIDPIGGGGLISGSALTLAHEVFGVAPHAGEPAAAAHTACPRESGARCGNDAPDTITDGLKATLGDIIRRACTITSPPYA